jgi:carbamoyl-phosphate synthase large subunit
VHSGDSACSLPPYSLSQETIDELKRQTALMAKGLNVVGLMNVQFAIQQAGRDGKMVDTVYVLEVNPRASRTVPFVSKATGLQLAKIAARCMVGQTLAQQGITKEVVPPFFSVKEAVFPFVKFPGVDTILGPEMKSTGEVMGVGRPSAKPSSSRSWAPASSCRVGPRVPVGEGLRQAARGAGGARPGGAGLQLVATKGTAAVISAAGMPVLAVNKVIEGRPHVVDMIKNHEIAWSSTRSRKSAARSSTRVRSALRPWRRACDLHHHRRRRGGDPGHAPSGRVAGLRFTRPA